MSLQHRPPHGEVPQRTAAQLAAPVDGWQHADPCEPDAAAGQLMSLKDWIQRQIGAERADAASVGGLHLAVAALLVEVLRADYDVAESERQQVVESVSRLLGLAQSDAATLVAEAERHIDQSHDLYQFTSQVNRVYTDTEKLQLLEALWRVAQADEVVHKYEEHLIRRVADLLYVPHSGFITAKLRATRADG